MKEVYIYSSEIYSQGLIYVFNSQKALYDVFVIVFQHHCYYNSFVLLQQTTYKSRCNVQMTVILVRKIDWV